MQMKHIQFQYSSASCKFNLQNIKDNHHWFIMTLIQQNMSIVAKHYTLKRRKSYVNCSPSIIAPNLCLPVITTVITEIGVNSTQDNYVNI